MTKHFKDGKPLRPNAKGRITKNTIIYTDADIENIEMIFPENLTFPQLALKQNRIRYESLEEIPNILPTHDLLPYPIDDHIAIGSYEQLKNLYLTFAILNNRLVDRVSELEKKIEKLENK